MTYASIDYSLEWVEPEPRGSATTATTGRLKITADSDVLWGVRKNGRHIGFEWSWVDLLEHLGEMWSWIELQEGWPAWVDPLTPLDFDAAVRERLAGLPRVRKAIEEQTLFEFRSRHDFSRALQGAVAPSLWLLREGREMWVATDTRALRAEASQVLEVLMRLGQDICRRLEPLDDERARQAVAQWKDRDGLPTDLKLEIATGLPSSELRKIDGGADDFWFSGSPGEFATNEIVAQARMAGPLGPEMVRKIVQHIRNLPRRKTQQLDELSNLASGVLHDAASDYEPAEQGYALAAWLRNTLRQSAAQKVDPREILDSWNVHYTELRLPTEMFDAMAVWGPNHGPAVIVNPAGKHAQDQGGRQATLAHEVGHLLVDRSRALPLGEVFGGHVPKSVEQRARAFAAELLAPRAEIGASFLNTNDPAEKVLKRLMVQYGASAEVIAWQAHNSAMNFPDDTILVLRSQVSEPHRFRF